MKKIIFLICLAVYCSQGFSQLIVMTDNTASNNWLAFQTAGTPPSSPIPWYSNPTTTGWGAPVNGFLAPLNSPPHPFGTSQNFLINASYNILATANNPQNYIMRPGGFIMQFTNDRSYLKYVFNVDKSDACKSFILRYNVDDSIKLYVNGVLVSNSNPGWLTQETFDISSKIKCGQNIIAAEIFNRQGTGYFFISDLHMDAGLLPNFELGHGPLTCTSTEVTLTATSDFPEGIYSWTGPNNFSSNSANPILHLQNQIVDGWYYCTVKKNQCCQYTKRIYIHAPVDCCDAYIEPSATNCYNYTFKLKSDVIDLDCWKWTLDGSAPISEDELNLTLYPGNHTICVQYLGSSLSDPNTVCCGTKCFTVNTQWEPINPQIINLPVPEGENCVGVQPCNAPFSSGLSGKFSYTLNGYNSKIGYYDPFWNNGTGLPPRKWIDGCIWHCLPRGSYILDFFDENGCLIKRVQINVI